MTTNQQATKHSRVDWATAIIHGLKLHMTGAITLNTTSYTEPQLEASFQKVIDAAQSTALAKQAYQTAVANERAIAVDVKGLGGALVAWVVATFGGTSTVMGDFGFKPRKKAKVKPSVKAKAVLKAGATKKARGIMGKKQRKQIAAPPLDTATTTNTDMKNGTSGNGSTAIVKPPPP
jgi:hypothetical protein